MYLRRNLNPSKPKTYTPENYKALLKYIKEDLDVNKWKEHLIFMNWKT